MLIKEFPLEKQLMEWQKKTKEIMKIWHAEGI